VKKINKKNKIVKNLKLKENLDRFVTYYTGETINGMPHGKGTSETYESVKGIDEKVHKKVGKKWVDNYQKFFLKKLSKLMAPFYRALRVMVYQLLLTQ
jgi:hypothetical protein